MQEDLRAVAQRALDYLLTRTTLLVDPSQDLVGLAGSKIGQKWFPFPVTLVANECGSRDSRTP